MKGTDMDSRIIGLLFSGFAIRLAAGALALWAGAEAWAYVADVFATAESTMAGVR